MATLRELDRSGAIFKIDPALPPGKQPERIIYASPRLVKWMSEVLPTLNSDLGVELSPLEQVGVLIEEFCGGGDLAFGPRFHDLTPVTKHTWELKTPDIRIIGWFAFKDCFFGYVADTANRIKDYGLYGGYRDEAVAYRGNLKLDPPKFVPGRDPYAVVSNYHCS